MPPPKRGLPIEQFDVGKRMKLDDTIDKITGLQELPNELLCLIAQRLPLRRDIISFARISKKIHDALDDVLSAEITITARNAWMILEHLSTSSPGSGRKVIYLDLTDFECPHPGSEQPCTCNGIANFNAMFRAATQGRLYNRYHVPLATNNSIQDAFQIGPEHILHKEQRNFLEVLISFCPNLKSMVVELPDPFKFDAHHRRVPQFGITPQQIRRVNLGLPPIAPFEGNLLTLLQGQLEMLVMTQDCAWQGPHDLGERGNWFLKKRAVHTLTFAGFSKLKSLDVPMTSLEHPRHLVFEDASCAQFKPKNNKDQVTQVRSCVLPTSLKYLRLRSCNVFTFLLLFRIASTIENSPPGKIKLRHIEIDTNCHIQLLLFRCQNADESRFSYERILGWLAENGVVVTWNTENANNVERFQRVPQSYRNSNPANNTTATPGRMPLPTEYRPGVAPGAKYSWTPDNRPFMVPEPMRTPQVMPPARVRRAVMTAPPAKAIISQPSMKETLETLRSLDPEAFWRKIRWVNTSFGVPTTRDALGLPEGSKSYYYDAGLRRLGLRQTLPSYRPLRLLGMSSERIPTYVHVLNSKSFVAQAWTDAAFFHAAVHWTKLPDRALSDKREIAMVWRHRVNGAVPRLWSLDSYQFSFRVDQDLRPPTASMEFFGVTHDYPLADSRGPRRISIEQVEWALWEKWYQSRDERRQKLEERRRKLGETGLELILSSFVWYPGEVGPFAPCRNIAELRKIRFDAEQWIHVPWGVLLHPRDVEFDKEP